MLWFACCCSALIYMEYMCHTMAADDVQLEATQRSIAEGDAAEREEEAQRELSRQQRAAELASIKRQRLEKQGRIVPASPDKVLAASGVASLDEIHSLLGAIRQAVQAREQQQQGGAAAAQTASSGSQPSSSPASNASNRRAGRGVRGAKATEEEKVAEPAAAGAAAGAAGASTGAPKISSRKR